MGKRSHTRSREIWSGPKGSTRTSKISKPYSSYVALMCDLVDQEPTSYEEAAQKKEWVEAMMEEYQSIMKNDVWDIVPKLEIKSVVSSKWIYKIKNVADGREYLWLKDSLRERELIMKRQLLRSLEGVSLKKYMKRMHLPEG